SDPENLNCCLIYLTAVPNSERKCISISRPAKYLETVERKTSTPISSNLATTDPAEIE
ncbi:6440_t:CDS:2, partial [Funneliformis caledonium]